MHMFDINKLWPYIVICHYFFVIILVSSVFKFHIGLISQRWYTNAKVMKANLILLSIPAISVMLDNEFGTVEYMVKIVLFHLENIREHYIFIKKIHENNNREKRLE